MSHVFNGCIDVSSKLDALALFFARLLSGSHMAERRTLLHALDLVVVWHAEDATLELWGTLPLTPPRAFYCDGTTLTTHIERHFRPGSPLAPVAAAQEPLLLAPPTAG